MGINEILSKINDRAKEEIAQIELNVQQHKKQIEDQMIQQIAELKNKILNSARLEANNLQQEILTPVKLKNKGAVLCAKQALIDKVFEDAFNKLLKDKVYINYLMRLVPKNINIKEAQVLIAKGQEINLEKIWNKDKPKQIDQTSSLRDGFIIKIDQVEYPCSLYLQLCQLKSDIEKDVSNVLFKDVK